MFQAMIPNSLGGASKSRTKRFIRANMNVPFGLPNTPNGYPNKHILPVRFSKVYSRTLKTPIIYKLHDKQKAV